MTASSNKNPSSSKNQGEGNREAARRYNEDTRDFVKSGAVEKSAVDAKQAVQGSEREQLKKAEEAGKARAKEEDPAVKR